MTYGYAIKCPKCGKSMKLDGIDRNVKGNQNEQYSCTTCQERAVVKVRYERIIKTEYFDKNEKMTVKWGSL